MNETTEKKPDAEDNGPLGGERLAAARRANEISARDIAKELHLDEPKVRALEQNQFEVLGAPVFAKGHLRKYAELVGVPIDDILSDYYKLNRATGAPPVVGLKRRIERDISLGPWIAGGVVVIIVAGAAWWWFNREPAPPQPVQTEPATLAPFVSDAAEEPVQDEAVTAEVDATEPESQAEAETIQAQDSETVAAQPVVVEAEQSEPVVEQEASLLPQVRVELTFSGDCWTEVSDASGRRLFYDLGTAGRVVALSGDEPLRVVLGDGDNVSIAVEGRDYPIPRSARSGRLARLSISRQ